MGEGIKESISGKKETRRFDLWVMGIDTRRSGTESGAHFLYLKMGLEDGKQVEVGTIRGKPGR